MAMIKKASEVSNPDYYVNCRGEVILKPIMNVQKLHGEYVIFDPSQIQEPSKFMVIGKSATWRIKAREND